MIMNAENLLRYHFNRYPKMEPQDAVKLLYQSVFGGGHLITDRESVLVRLRQERCQTPHGEKDALFEPIGNDLFRLSLAALGNKPSDETVLFAFADSASKVQGTKEDFFAAVKTLGTLAKEAPFPKEALDAYLTEYEKAGCAMVSHSEAYRAIYRPHYRVVTGFWARLWSVLTALEDQSEQGPVRFFLDGPSGTGKTTLAETLSRLYHCPVYHMDDYFLPRERKTRQRLAAPGGNVDYERFRTEILDPLTAGRPIRWRPYDCQSGCLGEERTDPPQPLTIIEGVYSCHEALRDAATLKVLLRLPLHDRLERIRERSGEALYQRFVREWIPLEDAYFRHMAPESVFDWIVDGRG